MKRIVFTKSVCCMQLFITVVSLTTETPTGSSQVNPHWWKLQPRGVLANKRPDNYSHLVKWNRTLSCSSGFLAYRLLFLDVVSHHLRMEYTYEETSAEKLDIDTLKSSLTAGTNITKFYEQLQSTRLLREVKRKEKVIKYLSNFDQVNDHMFWQILQTKSIKLIYDRKPALYHEWDQLLGPLTQSKYDKLQFQFDCLTVGSKCPSGYFGRVPECHDLDECAERYTNKCSPEAECVNQIGGYLCHCNSGFYGNGISCLSK